MKKDAIIESIKEVSLEELDQIIGAGNGVFKTDRKSTRLNSSHLKLSRMPSSA